MGPGQGYHEIGMGTEQGYCGVVMVSWVDMATEQGYHGVGMGAGQRYHGVSLLGHATSADWLLGDSKVSLKQPLQMLPLAALTVTYVLYKKME